MTSAPKGFRLHIGLFGRRNAGKSSLLNAMTRQQVSIVSEVAGTTTDPVEKPMEMLPLGPVLFIDTAGVDDVGALGRNAYRRRGRSSTAPTWGCWSSTPGRGGRSRRRSSASCKRGRSQPSWFSTSPISARLPPELLQTTGRGEGSAGRDRGDRRPGRAGLARGPDRGRPGRIPQPAGPCGRPRSAGRVGRAGRADRPRSAQGAADPAAGAGDSRSSRRRRLLPGGQGAGVARRVGAARAAAGPGGDRLAGLSEGCRRHAAGA